MSKKQIIIVGAGLAGCEAAYYLANQGIEVILYENKQQEKNPVQKLDLLAELVCSNSLRSNNINNAAGLLKTEMIKLNSLIMKSAIENALPAGDALAVDRVGFSQYITREITNHPLIILKHQEYKEIDLQIPTLITSGPLTSKKLQTELIKYLGNDSFYFYDAVAPIITKESINFDIAYYKSRYDKGQSQDYINCPFSKEQYELWYQTLIAAETIALQDFEKEIFFEGCMPIEVLAKRGYQTLLFGPLKPVGLAKNKGSLPYAVVQLRQDNVSNSLYNLVGFQTNLKWAEQKKVIHMIPGLEQAEIIRYGVMHKNNYINSPRILNEYLQVKNYPNLFMAGQLIGIEGYIESASMGIIAAINLANYLNNKPMTIFPRNTVIGSLIYYITHAESTTFQPMKANFGILPELSEKKFKTKLEKHQYLSLQAQKILNLFLKAM